MIVEWVAILLDRLLHRQGISCQAMPAAIKYLNDQELEQLQAAVMAELQRRGKKPPMSAKPVKAAAVSLAPAKLNAVLAAFKAGVRPSKIAKQFGIPQSDVRKVLASDRPKP